MDFFVEQLIKERRGVRYFCAVFGLSLAAFLLIFLSLFINLLPIMLVAVGYGWWWATSMLVTEYEYCVTNGDIDIDRIRGKRRRLRLVSVRGDKIESLTPHTPGTDLSRYNRVVRCHSCAADAVLWQFTYHSKKNGHTVVVFEPNQRVLTALVEGLSPLLRREVSKHLPTPTDEN